MSINNYDISISITY